MIRAPRVLGDDGEHGADLDLLSLRDRQFGHDAVGRGVDPVLHLHRLEPQDRLAGLHAVADRHRDPDDRAGHGREQRAGGDLVGGVDEARHAGAAAPARARSRRTPRRRARRPRTCGARRRRPARPRSGTRARGDDVAVGLQPVPGVPVGDVQALEADDLRLADDVAPPRRDVPQHGGPGALAGVDRQRGGEGGRAHRGGVGQRGGQRVQAVAVEERGVGVAGQERLVPQHPHEQVAVGDDAVDLRRAPARWPARSAACRRSGAQAMTLASIGS